MSQQKGIDFKWDDEDSEFEETKKQSVEESPDSFEELLKVAPDRSRGPRLMIGEKVKGTIVRVDQASGDCMVDLGGKVFGVVEGHELREREGEPLAVGMTIDAFVVAKRAGEVLLSYKMSASIRSAEDLERAKQNGTPVKGKVLAVQKGGFEVSILGKTAFCPMSQIDMKFVEDGTPYVGQEYEFLVEKVEAKGKNIVVSRQAHLRKEGLRLAKELMKSLDTEKVYHAVVTQIKDFGVFADIGGLEGLIHVSELSHSRGVKPQDFVKMGDKVHVKVLKVEEDEKGRPKVSLSMKKTSQDPWDDVDHYVTVGKAYEGRVTNLMPFGAFVELFPGLEGLVHISELSWTKKVHHPKEVLQVQDKITAVVKDLDREKRKLSLTLKVSEDDPWTKAMPFLKKGMVMEAPVTLLKPFGAFVEVAKDVTGLIPTQMLKRKYGEAYKGPCTPGKKIEVVVGEVDERDRRVQLLLTGLDHESEEKKDYEEYLQALKKAESDGKASDQDRSDKGSFGALLSAKLKEKRS